MFTVFRRLLAWFNGLFADKADSLMKNAKVMGATYQAAIEKNRETLQITKTAVGKTVVIQEAKQNELAKINEECEELEKIKEGAKLRAAKLVKTLKDKGLSIEDITKDSEYQKHQSAHQRAAQSLQAKEVRASELEVELQKITKSIDTYKLRLQEMQRENEQLQQEKHEAVADVQIAKQQDELNSLLTGIPTNTVNEDLMAARQARQEARASARLSMELAGNDAKAVDADYKAFAEAADAADEFALLVGLEDDKKEEAKSDLDPARLPEN